ncbi:MAG: DNA recombination protein RmuC [Bacilli bacterium]|nr:DNA recombination protein RmuC [Bacilli bacterium]
MEYIIIGLLVVILIVSVIALTKNVNETNITERLGKLETEMIKELGDFKSEINKSLNDDFVGLNDRIDRRLNLINDKVNERLDQNFEKTNKTFTSVLERLSKIDEAQKKIDTLSTDIVSLQGVLTDKKTRGIFGEVNLKHILCNVFGEGKNNIYRLQYTLSNGTIADSVVFAPDPLGMIAIDSKFPLENYQLMVDKNSSNRSLAERKFKADMKKHIDAIASKYIIPGETTDQAILFLPAEAIFAEVNAYHQDVIDYAYQKKVWICGPTTLISTLTTIQIIIKNLERDKYTKVIHQELRLLDTEFKRYKDRWDKLYRSIETVSKDVKDIHTTTDKITKRFDAINGVEMESITHEED